MSADVVPVIYDDLSPMQKRAVRESYVNAQGGKCCYCKASLNGPPAKNIAAKKVTPRLYPVNFFKFPVHLHHSHETGLTIGAVHNHCNAVCWEYDGE